MKATRFVFALLALLGHRAIVPVYQHTPLMISATKPEAGPQLSDRKKRAMQVEQDGNQHILIFEDPFCLLEHLPELKEAGARHFRIDLSYGIRDKQHAKDVIKALINHKTIPNHYDGNYSKTL